MSRLMYQSRPSHISSCVCSQDVLSDFLDVANRRPLFVKNFLRFLCQLFRIRPIYGAVRFKKWIPTKISMNFEFSTFMCSKRVDLYYADCRCVFLFVFL